MIAIEQDFQLILFFVRFKRMAVQTKATEQHFHVELFIILNKLLLTISLWMKP